jgi:L-gulono-1,4-lactone dehydrogenase
VDLPAKRITNFGRNVAFCPRAIFVPRTERELLDAIAQCKGRRIRVVGRLHSWSEVTVADDVMLDLRHLDQVAVEQREGKNWVTVGAGCQIKRLLAELDRQDAGTLPSLGLITEQTIAGAIATATHGSGRHSMSHYVAEVRVASFDPKSGNPVIREIREGPELQAARCSLGALGVIVSVSFWSRPQYNVEEHFEQYATLDEVLSKEADYPLQQFYLMPWSWNYIAQHRRETADQIGSWARLYRWYFFLAFDVTLHLIILTMVRVLNSSSAVRFFLRYVAPRLVVRNWRVVDKSQDMLVMEHELFRHVEVELFVQRALIGDAMRLIIALLKYCDGDNMAIDAATRAELASRGLLHEVDDVCGQYTHHYPICIRRVLPDDTLVSMTSCMDEPCYAISFISYASAGQRSGFLKFAAAMSNTLGTLFGARPHWGKLCPLSSHEVNSLYPRAAEFRNVCREFDPNGAFTSKWLQRMGLRGADANFGSVDARD